MVKLSLTSVLKESEVKAFLKARFKKPKLRALNEVKNKSMSKQYSLIGVAFDYILRLYLEYFFRDKAKTKTWVSEQAINRYKGKKKKLAKSYVNDCKKVHDDFIKTGIFKDNYVESFIKMAQLDFIVRCGMEYESLGEVDSGTLQDLINLKNSITLSLWKCNNQCLLNPTFGLYSSTVGGADADIILDDCLIDVKTTIKNDFKIDYFYQLIGYSILANLHGITVNKLSVYYSRHVEFVSFNIFDIVTQYEYRKYMSDFIELIYKKYKV